MVSREWKKEKMRTSTTALINIGIRLDWIGLVLGLDWIGLDWIGLDWIRLDWIRLDLI